jgi:hypothetical protein
MQAITTRFLGPTNSHDARIVAKCQAKRITVLWNDDIGIEENHRAAVAALVRHLGWQDRAWHLGGLPGGGYVAVQCAEWTRVDVTGADSAV